MEALRGLYDEIWVYGLPQIYEPLAASAAGRRWAQDVYTGYLRRDLPPHPDAPHELEALDAPSSWSPRAAEATATT